MSRKKYTRIEDATASQLRFREKRKWQIALRRYVVEESLCVNYAPYFGIDIRNIRIWFEGQFTSDMSWDTFGKTWQFDHIIPVAYFDFSEEEDLYLCWNFINLSVTSISQNQDKGHRFDLLKSRKYFEELLQSTGLPIAKKLLDKIVSLELADTINTEAQVKFINEQKAYLGKLKNFSFYEFELLNSGRSLNAVEQEIALLKNIGAV